MNKMTPKSYHYLHLLDACHSIADSIATEFRLKFNKRTDHPSVKAMYVVTLDRKIKQYVA